MIDKNLRRSKELLMAPLAAPLRTVHPNLVTAAACLFGLACAVAAAQGAYPLAIGLWIVNRILDGLDGTLARLAGKQSDLGGYLDIVLDTVVYAAIPFGLALHNGTAAAFSALALLLASFYINGATWMYLAALLEKRNSGAAAQGELTTVTMPGGLIEGAETVLLYSLFLLLPQMLTPLFILMAVLTLITAGQRVLWAMRALRT